MKSAFGEVFLFLTDLAWKSRVTIPVLVTTAFLIMDIRLQIEINIQTGQVAAADLEHYADSDTDDDDEDDDDDDSQHSSSDSSNDDGDDEDENGNLYDNEDIDNPQLHSTTNNSNISVDDGSPDCSWA